MKEFIKGHIKDPMIENLKQEISVQSITTKVLS